MSIHDSHYDSLCAMCKGFHVFINPRQCKISMVPVATLKPLDLPAVPGAPGETPRGAASLAVLSTGFATAGGSLRAQILDHFWHKSIQSGKSDWATWIIITAITWIVRLYHVFINVEVRAVFVLEGMNKTSTKWSTLITTRLVNLVHDEDIENEQVYSKIKEHTAKCFHENLTNITHKAYTILI